MDKFIKSPNLPIHLGRGLKTHFGIFISFLYIILFFVISFTFTKNFFSKENEKTKIFNIELNKNYTNFFFAYMISFPKMFQNNVRLLEYDTYYFTINNKECSESQIKSFTNESKDSDSVYICNEFSRPNNAYDFLYHVVDCFSLNSEPGYWMARDNTCNQNFTSESLFQPLVWMRYPYFNESRPEEDLVETIVHLKPNQSDFDYYLVNLQSLKLDQDYFRNIYKDYFFITPVNYLKQKYQSLYSFEMEIYSHIGKVVDKSKIPDLLIKISGLMGLFYIILFWINHIYTRFALKKYIFNNMFEEKDFVKIMQIFNSKFLKTINNEEIIKIKNYDLKIIKGKLCFKNYIWNSLGLPFKDKDMYNVLNYFINSKMSLENFIKYKHFEKNISKSNLTQYSSRTLLNMESSILDRIDIFSKSRSILFNRKEKIVSIFGKRVTFLYFFVCFVIFILTGFLCWNSENVKYQFQISLL
jgi:hypothetical protein